MALSLISCGTSDPPPEEPVIAKPTEEATGGKADAWDNTNDPTQFATRTELVFRLSELPTEGRSANSVWPSSYFPTYEDSVNVRWAGQGEMSPAEKYDRAFNGWTPSEEFASLRPYRPEDCEDGEWDREYYEQLGPLAEFVSSQMGNQDSRDGLDSDGDGQTDECDDRDGVDTWWGLCHAWVPAAIHEPRPLQPVNYNGVTFEVADLEALLMLAYDDNDAAVIGGRCDLFSSEADMARVHGCRLASEEAADGDNRPECTEEQLEQYIVRRDDHGRIVTNDCNDTNAGSFHVVMTNLLGLQKRAFAYDQTWDREVWNQPVVAFEVISQTELEPAQANALLGEEGQTYVRNVDAASLYEMEATTLYVTESSASATPSEQGRYERKLNHHYILEVDAKGDIIGGEWVGDSRTNHPDFLWDPWTQPSSSVDHLDLETLRMMVQLSRQGSVPGEGVVPVVVDGAGDLAIPDNSSSGATGRLDVDPHITVAGVQLELDIEHTYIGDLEVRLEHGLVSRTVHSNTGGSRNNIRTTLNVPGFAGLDAHGEWRLVVVDNADEDAGTLRSWRLTIVPASGTAADQPDPVRVSSEQRLDIPDNTQASASQTLEVSDEVHIGDVRVDVALRHSYIGDLTVTLRHNETAYTLHARDGGGNQDIDKSYVVTAFDGHTARGDWTLTISDDEDGDEGYLESWGLTFLPRNEGLIDGGDGDGPLVFPGEGPRSIPDNDAGGVAVNAEVPARTEGTVSVRVNLGHTYRGDLKLVLSHGDQTWLLHDRQGDDADDLSLVSTLDPQPDSAAGTWRLTVSDNEAEDIGRLEGWSIVVSP